MPTNFAIVYPSYCKLEKSMKKILVSFVLLIAIVVGYLFWSDNISIDKPPEYRTAQVQRGDIAQVVSANGTLSPVVLVNVGTQVTGEVREIYADFSDRVTTGQVLLRLDSSLLKAEVAQSLANVSKAQAHLDLAINNVKRGRKLYREKFISAKEWDKLLEIKKVAVAELRLAREKLAKNRANLNYATIRSPVSGVVIDRQVDVGQTVTASFQTPILFQIAQDLGKMQIDSSFAEADIGNIKPGQKATFTVDAFPDRVFHGVVKQIRLAPTIEQNVVTYNVVVNVENRDDKLLPGMTTYVDIKTAEHKNVLLVSNAALRFRPKTEDSKIKRSSKIGTVYKLVGESIVPVQCKLGISDSSHTEITSSTLSADDVVVIGYAPKNSNKSRFRIKIP